MPVTRRNNPLPLPEIIAPPALPEMPVELAEVRPDRRSELVQLTAALLRPDVSPEVAVNLAHRAQCWLDELDEAYEMGFRGDQRVHLLSHPIPEYHEQLRRAYEAGEAARVTADAMVESRR